MEEKEGLCLKGDNDPLTIFTDWLKKAEFAYSNTRPNVHPNAMSLSTVGADMQPSSRMVLLKDFNDDGFVFYTNLGSQKAIELSQNPKASLLFYWENLGRQIRIAGTVNKVSDKEADDYYNSRDLGSRIGAWASKQSQPLKSRTYLMARVAKATARFGNNPQRPKFWSGFRLKPDYIEFWQQGHFRLHDRYKYHFDHAQNSWSSPQRLYP